MGAGNQRDVAKILKEERRDKVAQAIADMLVHTYMVLDPGGRIPYQDTPEQHELIAKIRKVMDKAYAQA